VHRLWAIDKPRIWEEIAALVEPPGRTFDMETTAAKQAREKSVNPAALSASERHVPHGPAPGIPSEKKAIGYGMPCSRCHAYYPADMHVCPICKSPDRVSPNAPVVHSMPSAVPQPATGAQIDDDRERFLKELKSQAFASHTQINAAATFRCVLEHQHSGATEPAAVCHSCYGEARQQADRLEAALHMDAKEAAKIVYEAVWADTSDPNTTYLNAATALLSELRNRAGIGLLLGANQPLAH
jgi:hypothetical protein